MISELNLFTLVAADYLPTPSFTGNVTVDDVGSVSGGWLVLTRTGLTPVRYARLRLAHKLSPIYPIYPLDLLAQQVDGFVIHTHMLGYRIFPHICRTNGIRVFNPANDPNASELLDVLDEVLRAVGDIPLQLHIPARRLTEILPRFQGRRAIFSLEATDADDAMRQLETVNRYCPLER